jgi:ATP-dependent DNA ligase
MLQSKAGQPLARYFPEIVKALLALKPKQFIFDSEIVVPMGAELSFDQLLLRVHPAESRVRKLAAEHPASLIVFDFLAGADGKSLVGKPLRERRKLLETFAKKYFPKDGRIRLSPATRAIAVARQWFKNVGPTLDGIIAKRVDLEYKSGQRTGMQKIKKLRTADCVVGGFRYGTKKRAVGSLLLGLYDNQGLLHHVGFTSSLRAEERQQLKGNLESLIQQPGFTGRAPGGPSRWTTKRSSQWQPLAPKLVVEVCYDHFMSGRFRHGTKLLRWRPDKAPERCTLDQVENKRGASLGLLR